MEKEKIKEMLNSMINPDNEKNINNLLKSLDEISDKDLHIKLEQLNISDENIKQYINS